MQPHEKNHPYDKKWLYITLMVRLCCEQVLSLGVTKRMNRHPHLRYVQRFIETNEGSETKRHSLWLSGSQPCFGSREQLITTRSNQTRGNVVSCVWCTREKTLSGFNCRCKNTDQNIHLFYLNRVKASPDLKVDSFMTLFAVDLLAS